MESTREYRENIAPEKLTAEEITEVLRKINDPRLKADEDIEHFTIHLGQTVRHIPKRRSIPHVQENGSFDMVDIIEHIKQSLAEET